MSWIKSGKFRLVTNRPGQRYVFRRANNGNSEYNIPNSVKTKGDAIRFLLSKRNLRASRFRPKRAAKVARSPLVKPFIWNPANWKPEYAPRGRPLGHGETKERRAYSNYIAKIPFSQSPKYGPESPTLRLLRRAMLKSEGVNISASPKKLHFTCPGARKNLIKVIGRGRQGIVYKGQGFAAKICPKDMAAAARRDPQPSIVEYEIQKKVFEAAPKGVVNPYDIIHCLDFIKPSDINMENVQNSRKYDKSKQSIIFMEFCSGGSLDEWLEKKGTSDAALHHVISSVTRTLAQIRKKYPAFRHNDLWPGNIMVADRGFLIGDFGWARLEKDGTNPAVNTANGTNTAGKWGVGPSTDSRYDCHLFLNNLRDLVKRKGGLPRTSVFLDWAVPDGYRGDSSEHVQEWRLKYKDPCPGLPSLAQIVSSSYISGRKITSLNLAAARARLKKVSRGSAPKKARVSEKELKAGRAKLKPLGPRGRITVAQLKAGAKLKPGHKTTKKITAAILKNSKFNKMVEGIWRNSGAVSGKNYENAWNSAREKAKRIVELRLNRGNLPFSPNPRSVNRKAPLKKTVFAPTPLRVSPPRRQSPVNENKLRNAGRRLKERANAIKAARHASKVTVAQPMQRSPPKKNYRLSPSSKRVQMISNKGRWVYANIHMSLDELKKLAAERGKNIKGLRKKADIARKIFT